MKSCLKSMSPKLSVITTVYNCSQYLRDSIESVLSQTFEDFEFIIINDGSSDDTVDIVRSYTDSRIKFIDNADNRKIPQRRNEGILAASADLIAIHDGDDISLPNRFEIQLEKMNDKNLFCVGGHAYKISPSGDFTGNMDYPPEDCSGIFEMIATKCMNPIIDPTTMFRKDDFIALGKYTLEKAIYTVPDFDLWLRAILRGRLLSNVQEPLIKYRENPKGMTGENKKLMINQHMIVWTKFMRHPNIQKLRKKYASE